MALPVADFNDCRQKCRCEGGENDGKLYTIEQPCPFGYTFDEEKCDCGTPCEWCDNPFEPGFPESPASWGVCHKESGKQPAGFLIELVGRLDGYFRNWPSERCCKKIVQGNTRVYPEELCPFDLEYFTTWEGPKLIKRVPCPKSTAPNEPRCFPYELLYNYRPAGCDSIRGEFNPWQEGAFGYLWVIDPTKEPGTPEWEVGLALKPPGGLTRYNGAYWIGDVSIKISCYYENLNLFP